MNECICVGRINDALPHKAGCPMEAHVLTAAEAREARRVTRKLTRSEQEIGLRILRHAMKNLDRGKPEKAVQTILRGFGGIILAKLREKMPL